MTTPFDTLSFAKRLIEAGETREIAEAQALALRDFVMVQLATRDDLAVMQEALARGIGEVRGEIAPVRAEVQGLVARLVVRIALMLSLAVVVAATLVRLS